MTDTIIRLPEVLARTSLSRSHLYQKISEGTFPKQFPIGARAIGFSEKAVNQWIEDTIRSVT